MADLASQTDDVALLELAGKADRGEIDAAETERVMTGDAPSDTGNEVPAEITGKETKPDDQPGDAETKPGTEPAKKAEDGSRKSEDGKAESGKPDSEFVKAKKDAERFERNWQKLEAERKAFEAEKQELERLRAERRQADPVKAEGLRSEAGTKDANGYTAADYEAAAQEFEAEGETALAKQARERAAALKGQETQQQSQQEAEKFHRSWGETCDAVCKQKPDLLKLDSPIAQEVQALLKSEPLFSQLPDGFARAVQIAELRIEAGSVPGLREQNAKLVKELEAANAKLAIGGNNPARPVRAKSFGEMTSAEQERELLQAAEELDRQGFAVVH
jgi:hypothetical protein